MLLLLLPPLISAMLAALESLRRGFAQGMSTEDVAMLARMLLFSFAGLYALFLALTLALQAIFHYGLRLSRYPLYNIILLVVCNLGIYFGLIFLMHRPS